MPAAARQPSQHIRGLLGVVEHQQPPAGSRSAASTARRAARPPPGLGAAQLGA